MGTRSVSVPTHVVSVRSLYPFLLLPVAAHIWSASALMISFTIDSARERRSSYMFTKPSSNLGMASAASGVLTSAMLSIAVIAFL